jgi:hypothetical protein
MKRSEHPYRAKETLFDVSFEMGYAWSKQTLEAQEYILDTIGGSRGLAEQAVLWAEEFETMYRLKETDPQIGDYLQELDEFFTTKWSAFIAEHVAKRMTE